MAANKKFYFKSGVRYVRDINQERRATRGEARFHQVFLKDDNINPAKLGTEHEGLFAYLAKGTKGVGGGDGFYYFDGTYFRKVGFGEGAKVTCTAGESIIAAADRNLLLGMSLLPITAASAVTVGTATTKPILPDGYPGQELTIINVGANTITLTDKDTMAESNLELTAATVAVAANRCVKFVFSSNTGNWHQV